MKPRETNSESKVEDFPVWTYEQATQAIPYIKAVMISIRDLFLQKQSKRHRIKQLENKPGRPDRNAIIERQEAAREADQLQDQLAEAAHELAELNVHCVQPASGIAMIPFVEGEQLAWFVFELFDPKKITSWRYHSDPLFLRRPFSELQDKPGTMPLIV